MKTRMYLHDRVSGLTRRNILQAAAAIAGGAALGSLGMPGRVFAQTQMSLGDMTIRSVSDGNLVLPVSFLFPEVAKEDIEAILAANGMNAEALEPECNLTLVENGDRLVLFDAGAGPNFMPSAGKLPAALDAAGVDPSAITDVVFTHAHPDHLWGILDDFDEIAFPDANLHFGRAEWEFWTADDVVSKMSEGRESFAVGAQNRMEVMADRVQLFDGGAEILPGIEAIDTKGHTPGHMAFAIHGGGESLMVLGDALTNHVVSFERPDWPSGSDQDPLQGIATRQMLLDRLTADKMAFIGYHLPNGGMGRAEKSGDAYRFVPAT